ncbi:MAG: sulfite exporter TauE/SafE family protein [Pseudomonadota bacterium]|nr:sulfite exporter TauE/SafE family protein [Pseudomonadota bacterium]
MFEFLHPGAIFGAFLFGLAGSLHCLGMCGGVAGMAMLVQDAPRAQYQWLFSWQGGRTVSYALFGAVAGSFGLALRHLPAFTLVQAGLVVVTSVALVLSGGQLMGWRSPLAALEQRGAIGFIRLLPLVRRWMPPRTPWRAAVMGCMWGLVPCGFLYTMLTAAATFGRPLQGALMMAAFALGTMPMLFMAASGIRLGLLRQKRLRFVFGLLVAGTGLLGVIGVLSGSRLLAGVCA